MRDAIEIYRILLYFNLPEEIVANQIRPVLRFSYDEREGSQVELTKLIELQESEPEGHQFGFGGAGGAGVGTSYAQNYASSNIILMSVEADSIVGPNTTNQQQHAYNIQGGKLTS